MAACAMKLLWATHGCSHNRRRMAKRSSDARLRTVVKRWVLAEDGEEERSRFAARLRAHVVRDRAQAAAQ
ncbi:heat-shock protein HtpX [Sesbania bispinosa]|nr:heat-shock protein HtpX [Sesbania bispinosa]